ncbi:hypothetical protein OROHE_012267 [Orobanche hederae]
MSRWTNFLQSSTQYEKGVKDFLNKAFATRAIVDQISCPCKACYLRFWHHREKVSNHLIAIGTEPGSVEWYFIEYGDSVEGVDEEDTPGSMNAYLKIKEKLAPQSQQDQEVVSPPKEQQCKVTIAPGSMNAYLKIKEKLRQEELRRKQNAALVQNIALQNVEFRTSKSKRSLRHELEKDHGNFMGLSDSHLEPERDDANLEGVHLGNDDQLEVQTHQLIDQDQQGDLSR